MTPRPYDLLDEAGKRAFRHGVIGMFSLMIGFIVSHIALLVYALTAPKFDWLLIEVWSASTWAVMLLGAAIINRTFSRLYKECQSRGQIGEEPAASN